MSPICHSVARGCLSLPLTRPVCGWVLFSTYRQAICAHVRSCGVRLLDTGGGVPAAFGQPAPPRAFATEQRQGDKQQEDGDGQPAS
ncbi:hypothetical protein LNP02_21400 [Klebsiella variicola subsp. variicola]|nr:hypothetical protein [Klebsiella variicola subsp. variicola]